MGNPYQSPAKILLSRKILCHYLIHKLMREVDVHGNDANILWPLAMTLVSIGHVVRHVAWYSVYRLLSGSGAGCQPW